MDHVTKSKTDYTFYFKKFHGFDAFFVNKIHVGVQKFIHLYSMGFASKLNIKAIKFRSFLKTIENREIIFVRLPAFIKKKEPKK